MNKMFGYLISTITASLVLLGVASFTVYEPQGVTTPLVVQAASIAPPTSEPTRIIGMPTPTKLPGPYFPYDIWLPYITTEQSSIIRAVPVDQPTSTLKPGTPIRAKISWYNPALGGPNCFTFVNGECLSRMASGRNWAKYIDKAVACPPEFPFGTEFDILDKTYTCWDRGGKIQRLGPNLIWLDILTKKAVVPFGTVVKVFYRLPYE